LALNKQNGYYIQQLNIFFK